MISSRLLDFAVRIIKLAGSLSKIKIGSHIANQIIPSGTAPAPNYGEAQGAECSSDFIHKKKICLKELPESKVEPLIDENEQLISIFVKSIKTAKSKNIKYS